MKHRINFLLSIFLILFSGMFIACSDNFFESQTGDRITPDQHYNSGVDAELSVNGCYVMIQDVAEKMVVLDGLLSDQMDITENAEVDLININQHNLLLTNTYLPTTALYRIILNANEILPNLPPIIKKDRDFDSTICKAYMGALITIRSWAYFTLVKYYNQAVWYDPSIAVIDPEQPVTYRSKSEIIDILIADLAPYIDEADIFRFPIDHYALLGELYLEKNDYVNAIKYLKYCVDGPAHPTANPVYMITDQYEKESWLNLFINSQSQWTAVIAAIPYSIEDGHPNSLQNLMRDSYMIKPTQSIIQLFESDENADGTGDLWRGLDISYTYINDQPVINKYLLDNEKPSSADVIISRDADVHLLLAEAMNRNNQPDAALLILNKGIGSVSASKRPEGFNKWAKNKGIRGRVDLVERTVPDNVSNKMLYIEDLIIQERAQELAFEGKRYADLMRIARRRNDPSYLANKVAAKFTDQATGNAVKAKLMNMDNWYLPSDK